VVDHDLILAKAGSIRRNLERISEKGGKEWILFKIKLCGQDLQDYQDSSFFYFRFPDETENTQSAFSGDTHFLKFGQYVNYYQDTTFLYSDKLKINENNFRRRRLSLFISIREMNKNKKNPNDPVNPV